jgi:excisionase family DNA binding protein
VEAEQPDYQDVVDQALQLVYSHHHRLISQLHPAAFSALTLDQLRQGPLGQDLFRLASLARGEIREPKERVLEAIESVVQLLFWPAAADDYSVPRSFWDTDLGRMLALAKYRAYDPAELVSIGNAAQQLGVTRPTIYRWMDDRTLNYVRDDMSGRTFVVRRDIDNLKRVAEELSVHE